MKHARGSLTTEGFNKQHTVFIVLITHDDLLFFSSSRVSELQTPATGEHASCLRRTKEEEEEFLVLDRWRAG